MKRCLQAIFVFALACSFCACKKSAETRKGPGGPIPVVEGGKEPASCAGLEGGYTGSGTNPGGGSYECYVVIGHTGEAYRVTWYFDGGLGYEGAGVLKGNTFVVGFSNPRGYGVVAYTVKADGSLDGTWAGKGGSKLGTEKLTKK